MQLAKGFEILDDTIRGECVEFVMTGGEELGAAGQVKDYNLKEVSDNLGFSQMIDLSVAAAYSAAYAKAEATAKFVKDQKLHQYAATVVATIKVSNPPKVATKVKLTSQMAALALKSPADFRQKCGSYYVSAVTTGGELDGFVSIETSNRQEKETLSAMFKAEYGTFKASGSIDTNLQNEISKRQSNIKIHEVGGTTATVGSPEELIAKLRGFPEAIATGNARPYRASLQSYRTLPNYPAASQLSETDRELDKIMTFALQYMSLLEDVSYINNHKNQFFMPGSATDSLNSLRAEIEKDKKIAETTADKCRKGKTCSVPALRNPDDFRGQLPLRYKSPCPPASVNIQEQFPDQFGVAINAHKLIKGDGDISGHNPQITLRLSLNPEGSRLMLKGTLQMKEDRPDYTTFIGEMNTPVFDTAGKPEQAHCSYDVGKIPREGVLEVNGKENNHEWIRYTGGTGFLLTANCLSDTDGNDAGKLGCKQLSFTPIQLLFLHEEDALPPNQIQARKAEAVRK
jgi:hypothetical protein